MNIGSGIATDGNQYVFINSSTNSIIIILTSPNIFAGIGVAINSIKATILTKGSFTVIYYTNIFYAINANGTAFT